MSESHLFVVFTGNGRINFFVLFIGNGVELCVYVVSCRLKIEGNFVIQDCLMVI